MCGRIDRLTTRSHKTPARARGLKDRGAIGEVAGRWFGADGQDIVDPGVHAIGISLDALREVVASGKRVVAVVAARLERVAPLKAALEHKLVNVLVTGNGYGRARATHIHQVAAFTY